MPTSSSSTFDLKRGADRFRLLVESVTDYAIFTLEPDGRVASWNAGANRIKGYTADEIIGQHFSRFYTEEDKARNKPQWELEKAIAEGRVEGEGWRVRKDGTQFWALVVITAMRDARGELIGFGKVTRDLTERKEAEERLRASEKQFRMLMENVEEYAIYMLDPEGKIATWNVGAEKIKQYRADEIIGQHFARFYTEEDVAAGRPQQNLEAALRRGHIRTRGMRVRKDGTQFPADIVLTALRDESGILCGFSKITRDITDQVQTREIEAAKMAAEKSNQAKDEFLAALSHELRTPLTPALAAASYLADNPAPLPPEMAAEMETIRRNIQLEARLIDDLLDMTRISRGKIDLQLKRVDAHATIREALNIVQPDLAGKKLQLVANLAATKPHIWADPVRIEQVFWNLISNAVKFTDAGGRIEIRTSNDEEDKFQFVVIDSGIGIERERQQTIFRAFEQGSSSISRQFGGLGLGLAISKNLVQLHNGSISVESAGLGQGACFAVTLDIAPEADYAPGASAPPRAVTKNLRILLVEDHGDTRRVLARLLSHFGHEISAADCVKNALKLVNAKQFDALLSDIGLPDGTGYDVATEAKQKQGIPAVALTGFGMEHDRKRSREAGFDFHLTKPVDFHELRTVLGKLGS